MEFHQKVFFLLILANQFSLYFNIKTSSNLFKNQVQQIYNFLLLKAFLEFIYNYNIFFYKMNLKFIKEKFKNIKFYLYLFIFNIHSNIKF